MNLTHYPSCAFRRATTTLLLGLASLGAALTSHAEQTVGSAPVVSKTTLAEARDMWATTGATAISEGHLAIGGGNGVDGGSTVGLEQVLLVTVAGVDFESLPTARYAFVDGVLYAISADLRRKLVEKTSLFKELNEEELAQLEQSLTRKYGKPRGLKDLIAGQKPNVFIWDLRDNEMTLTKSDLSGYRLTLKNKALVKKVEAYTKAECKKHPRRGPVTATCI